jgi:multidrug efflux pump
VIVDVQRQPGANVVQTVNRIRAELVKLGRAIPAGVDLRIVQDRPTRSAPPSGTCSSH